MNAGWGLVNKVVEAFNFFHYNRVFDQLLSLLRQMDFQWHREEMVLNYHFP